MKKRTRNRGLLACAFLYYFVFCRGWDVGNHKSRTVFRTVDLQEEQSDIMTLTLLFFFLFWGHARGLWDLSSQTWSDLDRRGNSPTLTLLLSTTAAI